MKKVVILQNVDFEEPGFFLEWTEARGFSPRVIRAYAGESLPAMDEFSHLMVLGAPREVTEIPTLPWLAAEADFLRLCLAERKPVFAVCFGAQLLAHLLGGEVHLGAHAEIGWHPFMADAAGNFGQARFPLFQWHRGVFTLPPGAVAFGRSEATPLQGFLYGERVVGLAGHPEIDESLVRTYIDRCWASGQAGAYVQTPTEMLASTPARIGESRPGIEKLLDAWVGA